MNQSLRDCWQSSVLLWDRFGLIPPEVRRLGSGFTRISFHGGTKFWWQSITRACFLLVFLFDFPWYKEIRIIRTYVILILSLILTFILVLQIREFVETSNPLSPSNPPSPSHRPNLCPHQPNPRFYPPFTSLSKNMTNRECQVNFDEINLLEEWFPGFTKEKSGQGNWILKGTNKQKEFYY